MSHLEQRPRLSAVPRAHSLHVSCPRAPQDRPGSAHPRSQWLRAICAIACHCTERSRGLLVLTGCAGIVGFCAASIGFIAGALGEAQYLIGVAGSLGLFAASVLVVRLGDPYELERMECQRRSALQTRSVRAAPSTSPQGI